MFSLMFIAATGLLHAALTPEEVTKLPLKDIEARLPDEHPSSYFLFSARLLQEGKKDDAVFWFYIGSIRYRFYLAANPKLDPSGDPVLFGTLQETIGGPINEYAGGDPKKWAAQIDQALKWDEENNNKFTSKKKFKQEYQEIRDGLSGLKKMIEENIDQIKEQRKRSGLETKG
jgi:hypothetical protein